MKFNFNLKFFLFYLIFTYLILGLTLFIFQNNLIYKPTNQDFFNCENLKYTSKINYNGTRFYYKKNSDILVVFYHGNYGSSCDRYQIANFFNQNNFSFILVEYSGFSNDNKTPSIKLLTKDANNINEFIKKNISYNKLVIGGESLGSAISLIHTNIINPNKVFLISPFDKLENVILDRFPFYLYPINFLLKENYNNYDKFSNFSGDLIIFHGSKDKVIPQKLSLDLYNSIEIKNKKYEIKKNKGHNNMYSIELFNEIKNFIEE